MARIFSPALAWPALLFSLFLISFSPAFCQVPSQAVLAGSVADATGQPLAQTAIRIVNARGRTLATTATDAGGRFRLAVPAGAAALRISHPGFLARVVAIGADLSSRPLALTLALSPLRQTVIVAATGTAVPQAQLGMGASVTTRAALRRQLPLTLAEALRLTPGLGLVTSGPVGSLTTPAMRGGAPQFLKLLLDGEPLQRFDFGSYNLSALLPASIEELQVVRGPDSVIHGSDAVAGVIDVRSRRGSDVPAPEVEDESLAGAYATVQQSDQLLGAWRRNDYAFRFASLDTHNQQPNSKDRALNYGGDFGFALPGRLHLRAMAARIASSTGQAGTLDFNGLPDNAFSDQGETYQHYTLSQQTSERWSNRIDAGQAIVSYFFDRPAAFGLPVATPFGPGFAGLPVTIRGANGYAVSGQAALDPPAVTTFHSLRRDVDWQSAFDFSQRWRMVGGYRYDNEDGLSNFQAPLSRHDHGLYADLMGGWGARLFATAGMSEDWNTPFGRTFNPQGSVAWLARSGGPGLGETRLRASAGTALDDPNLYQEASSLYLTLLGEGRTDLIAAQGVGPLRPQRARSGEVGLDQFLAGDQVRLSLTGFDAHYYDLIEFVPPNGLVALGVAPSVANATPFGANLNSLAEVTKGLEASAQAQAGSMHLEAAYTYQGARVVRSVSSDALFPTFNPSFPTVAIGAYAPLVGARPFRVPPHTFSARMAWAGRRGTLGATFWFESRRDDSTFLSDLNFGPTLLLPNRNLEPAFARLNLTGLVPVGRRVVLEGAVENVLNDRAVEVIGFPAPGITARAGLRFTWPAPLPH